MQFLAPVARELSLLGLYLGKPDHPGESLGVVPSLRKSTLLGTMHAVQRLPEFIS